MVAPSNERDSEDDVHKDGTKINVFLRLRPINNLEKSKRSTNCIEIHEAPGSDEAKREITVDSPLEGESAFEFNQVCFYYYERNYIKSFVLRLYAHNSLDSI